ncbi:hypothetical protein N2152v2_004555 [Parachlorella kessleri]
MLAELDAAVASDHFGLADNEQEWFDVVDETDTVISREKRSVCHRKGLLHRACYVWVFNPAGELLLQKRSPLKKIGPSQWDLSVAEHLQPGETYRQGAVRGLQEELGVSVSEAALEGPLAPTHKRELHQGDFHDVELVQSFRLVNFTGNLSLDIGEVADAKYMALDQLRRHATQYPEAYTGWFLAEVASLNWFQREGDGSKPP